MSWFASLQHGELMAGVPHTRPYWSERLLPWPTLRNTDPGIPGPEVAGRRWAEARTLGSAPPAQRQGPPAVMGLRPVSPTGPGRRPSSGRVAVRREHRSDGLGHRGRRRKPAGDRRVRRRRTSRFVEPVRPGSRPRRRVAGRARAASTRPRPRRGGPAWPMGVVGSGTPLGHADFACRSSSRCRCAGCIRQACWLDDRKPPCSRRHFTFLGGRVLHPERYRRGGCGHTAGRGSDGGDDAWPRAVPDRRWSAPPGHRTRECSPRPREGPPPARWV